MHLHSSSVSVGKFVQAGDIIGTTGGLPTDKPNCGHSTGAHLHLSLRIGNIKYDPYPFFMDSMTFNGKAFFGSNTSSTIENLQSVSKYIASKGETNLNIVDETATESVLTPKQAAFVDRLAPGIWQIVKLLMDSSVSAKQVVSTDINLQQGSLFSFFRKVCQEPLVELMSDTYGSQFYFLVRRPPTDRYGIREMLENGAVCEIADEDIISTNLHWHKGGGISWYQFLPQAELLGIKELTLYVPAVFFSEYAAVWGSKPMIVQSNYYTYKESGKWNADIDNNGQNQNTQIDNAIEDFRYLIESNAYLPFTREGSITTKLNRKLKRGMFASLSNGEIYHIDSVSHNFEINKDKIEASSTINVSRGIISELLEPKKINGKIISYFHLINFGDYGSVNFSNWREIVSKWKVNVDVFNYFLTRQQLNLKSEQYQQMKREVNVTSNLTDFGKQKFW
jgi:hypothetical protein